VDQGLHTIDMDESIVQIDEFEFYEEFPRSSVAAPPQVVEVARAALYSEQRSMSAILCLVSMEWSCFHRGTNNIAAVIDSQK
jgi:hypothetical protein